MGLEKAGFYTEMVIEIDKWAVETLKANRPNWNILKADITKVSTDEIRPFSVRENARIQSFPDSWVFKGSMAQQYKQIVLLWL